MASFPERVHSAYTRWREQATIHGFTPAHLPTDADLQLAAEDPEALTAPHSPHMLHIWRVPLQRLRLMVSTGFEDATRRPLEPAMFVPVLPGGRWPTEQANSTAPNPPTAPAPATSTSTPTQPARRAADTMVDDILGSALNPTTGPTPLDHGLDDGAMWPTTGPAMGTAGPIPHATGAPAFTPSPAPTQGFVQQPSQGQGQPHNPNQPQAHTPNPNQAPQGAQPPMNPAASQQAPTPAPAPGTPAAPAAEGNAAAEIHLEHGTVIPGEQMSGYIPNRPTGPAPAPEQGQGNVPGQGAEDPAAMGATSGAGAQGSAQAGPGMPGGMPAGVQGQVPGQEPVPGSADAYPNPASAAAAAVQPGFDYTQLAEHMAQPIDDVLVDQDFVGTITHADEDYDPDLIRTDEDALRDYDYTDFARLAMFDDSIEPIADASVHAKKQHDGSVVVTWEAPEPKEGMVRLYRVVSEEEEFDRDPDFGEHRATTVGTHWVDEDEFTTALRFYQVWCHEGKTEALARDTAPRFVGETWLILPVSDMTLTVAGREIKGQWSPLEGTDRVAVYAAKERDRRVAATKNEICHNQANQQGFIFSPPQRGVNWKFVARRIVTLRGFDRFSSFSDIDMIAVPAEVHAVDINVDTTEFGDETLFDVTWENPSSGEVRIYRTNQAPDDGVTGRTVDVHFLEDFGLPQENWVNDLNRGDDACRVPWPEDWYSIFLTPVTVVGEKCQVGRSFSAVRVGEVTGAQLFERVSHQLATFGWPRNALEVAAYFVSEDPFTGTTSEEHLTTIDRETYNARGGMRLKLNDQGRIKLQPSKYYNNEKILGEPAILDYAGVTRMKYALFGQAGAVCLAIYAQRPERVERRFTLRIQRGRLPLEAGDGLEVNVRQMVHGAPHSEFLPGLIVDELFPDSYTTYFEIDPRMLTKAGPGAFLRLFPLDLEDETGRKLALEDPPVKFLHLRRLKDEMAAAMTRQAH